MRALGVARVSTQEQAQGDRFSIPHQRQRILDYCLQRSWDLVDVIEYVQSGGSNYRELQTILQEVKRDHIQVVVVNELDRLARDMISTLLFLEDLQKVGCRFVAVADDLDLTTPDGELKMMILSVFAHYFRRQLARKVKGGLAERARQGKHHGGRPPYGFIFQGDKLQPHPEQAAVVRQIYSWYVQEGVGGREIAKRLNAQGIPTQSGQGSWASTEVLRLLRRPANVGDLRHGELEFFKERTGITHKVHRDDALMVVDAHTAIVDRTTWEKAQRLMQTRSRSSGRQVDSPYLLSGLVYCGLCGRTMVPVKNRHHTRYVCRGYQSAGLCTITHAAPVDEIERSVIETLLADLENPTDEELRNWVDRLRAESSTRASEQRERERLERRLAELPAMRQRAEEALLQGAFTIPHYKTVQAKIDQEDERLRATLHSLPSQHRVIPSGEEAQRLRSELAAAAETFRRAQSLHNRRELIRRYVTRIEIRLSEMTVYYGSKEISEISRE